MQYLINDINNNNVSVASFFTSKQWDTSFLFNRTKAKNASLADLSRILERLSGILEILSNTYVKVSNLDEILVALSILSSKYSFIVFILPFNCIPFLGETAVLLGY